MKRKKYKDQEFTTLPIKESIGTGESFDPEQELMEGFLMILIKSMTKIILIYNIRYI